MASIEVIQGPDKGRTIPLRDSEALIGREGDTLRLSDSTVSRRHARLSREKGRWFIEDLGSANGTFLNSARITRPARLHVGDQIRCGQTLLVFGGPMPHAPPMDVDENGGFLETTIRASVPANDDSVIIPTPEAGAEAIGTLRVIYDFANEVSSLLDLRQLAERVMNLTFDLVPAERGFVLLFGPEGELIPMASRYHDEGGGDGKPLPISRTIINEVVTRQVGIHSYNAMHDKRFSAGESVHDYGIRSAICVPIKGREKVLGVIHVDASEGQDPYSTEQLRLLTAIGSQTGLAVENVQLYQSAVKSERLAAVGETVAALSHHIKNILQALGGGADVVERALLEGNVDRAGSTWPIIRRNIDRINIVILNMLAYSKPRRQVLESVNVNHVLNECVELATPLADENGIALITDLNDLPPVPADAGGLHQAFLNLLTNALDAVRPQEGAVTIASDFDPLTRVITVRVSDNGAGIPPEELDRIFELFHTTKGARGTGLGLAVTRKVVREHNGTITVDSAPGRGTTFTVRLPSRTGTQVSSGDTHTP
ncbi:MAG TPA: ATP-binding protein [Phycisphaerae bacterium]|nr:ATP-binding protein [Phycisphaerae bacterium]